MPTYNGNLAYIKIGSTVVDAYFKDCSLTPSLETVDVTAGSGTAHRERAEGLADTAMTVTIVYDTATLQTYITTLKPGTYTVEYGPEGQVAGKPKHIQQFILTDVPHSIEVGKAEVQFQLSFEAAAAPAFNMFDGAVW